MALLRPFGVLLVSLLTFLFYAALTEQKIVRDLVNGIGYANFVKQDNKRLDTELLASLTAQSSTDCGGKCLMNENCFSVNYGGGQECQLLATNMFRYSTEMTTEETFQHFSAASPCDNEPCLSGTRCLPVYENNSYICDAGRTLASLDGTWTAFWWYDIDTAWPSHENDVLAYDFGHCQSSDPYCFGRLPSNAIEDSTEMLAVDSEGTQYKWSFDSTNSVAHAAWRAFHDHQVIPFGEVRKQSLAWNPEVLNGLAPVALQKSFMYREQNGVMSVMLDDDSCDCSTTLSLGHGMCYESHRTDISPANQYGVDTLYEASCIKGVVNAPRTSVGLILYFRRRP